MAHEIILLASQERETGPSQNEEIVRDAGARISGKKNDIKTYAQGNVVVALPWGFHLNSVMRRLGFQYDNPFFDAEFIGFMRAIPARLRMHSRLYLQVHKRIFARTAHLRQSGRGVAPQRHANYLYLYRGESFARQFCGLLLKEPIAAGIHMRQLFASRASDACAKFGWGGWHRERERQNSVFPQAVCLLTNVAYRQRFLELLESAANEAPDFFNRAQLSPSYSRGVMLSSESQQMRDFAEVRCGKICHSYGAGKALQNLGFRQF